MPCNRLISRELAMTLAKKSDWPELLQMLSATVTVGLKPPRGDPREMPFIEWSFLFWIAPPVGPRGQELTIGAERQRNPMNRTKEST
jgi:hypothetical protein